MKSKLALLCVLGALGGESLFAQTTVRAPYDAKRGASDAQGPQYSNIQHTVSGSTIITDFDTNEDAKTKLCRGPQGSPWSNFVTGGDTSWATCTAEEQDWLQVHTRQFDQLACGTTYYFVIVGRDRLDNKSVSAEQAVATQACGGGGGGGLPDYLGGNFTTDVIADCDLTPAQYAGSSNPAVNVKFTGCKFGEEITRLTSGATCDGAGTWVGTIGSGQEYSLMQRVSGTDRYVLLALSMFRTSGGSIIKSFLMTVFDRRLMTFTTIPGSGTGACRTTGSNAAYEIASLVSGSRFKNSVNFAFGATAATKHAIYGYRMAENRIIDKIDFSACVPTPTLGCVAYTTPWLDLNGASCGAGAFTNNNGQNHDLVIVNIGGEDVALFAQDKDTSFGQNDRDIVGLASPTKGCIWFNLKTGQIELGSGATWTYPTGAVTFVNTDGTTPPTPSFGSHNNRTGPNGSFIKITKGNCYTTCTARNGISTHIYFYDWANKTARAVTNGSPDFVGGHHAIGNSTNVSMANAPGQSWCGGQNCLPLRPNNNLDITAATQRLPDTGGTGSGDAYISWENVDASDTLPFLYNRQACSTCLNDRAYFGEGTMVWPSGTPKKASRQCATYSRKCGTGFNDACDPFMVVEPAGCFAVISSKMELGSLVLDGVSGRKDLFIVRLRSSNACRSTDF